MFTCTVCGLKKSKLANNSSEFEFRRRRQQDEKSFVNGLSEWCPKCQAVRFYFWIDDKKPTQHLEEQPRKQQVLDAVAQRKIHKLTSASKERKMQHDVCREAHAQLKREIIGGLTTKLPHRCLWERQIRSQSEAKDRSQYAENIVTRQRSKSVISQSILQGKQQAELKRKHVGKLDAMKPFPKNLDDQAYDGQDDMYNNLEQNTEEPGTSRAGKRQKQKLTPEIKKQLELADRWQEEVAKHENSLLNSSFNTSYNKAAAGKGQQEFNLPEKEPSKLAKKHFTAGSLVKSKRPSKKNAVPTESTEYVKEQLKSKLVEKKLLVDEWECIRRRVNNECQRVNAELNELKYEADLEIERSRLGRLVHNERQLGGAQLLALNRSIVQEKGEEKQWTAATESIIADALNERINPKPATLQEKSHRPQELSPKEDRKEIVPKSLSDKKTLPKPAVTKKLTKTKTKNIFANLLPKSSQRRLRSGLRDKGLQKKLNVLVSNVQRACCRGFPEDPQQALHELATTNTKKLQQSHPPQFTTKPCTSKELFRLLRVKPQLLQPKSYARVLNVCRAPIICPDADCRGMFFISDFNAHLEHEHSSLPMERIKVHSPKTFFLNTHIALQYRAKCQMVFFVKDKVIDNDNAKPPDMLPVLVMTAKVRMLDIFGANYSNVKEHNTQEAISDTDIVMIWLTSVRPEDSKIVATISVWPTSTKPLIEYLNVHTSQIYSIRSSQKLNHIFKSNCVMTLPGNYVNSITNNGDSLLAVQVQIH